MAGQKIILYHGSPNEFVTPQCGLGEDRHDYGRGFYLTESLELAKEWAVCRPNAQNGWVHCYELDTTNLKILDFQQHDILSWLAELMKHRDASDSKRYKVLAKKFIYKYGIDANEFDVIKGWRANDSKRYKVLAKKFINKYGIDANEFDVIKGWRANASFFYIAKEFVRDNIDIEILEELLSLGGLGIQYCIKTQLAYSKLIELDNEKVYVDYEEFNIKYNERDANARNNMRKLINSDANKVENVFSTIIER